MLSIVYLNRNCPRACPQCSIRGDKPHLSAEEWKEAFQIIELLSEFTIILGNEPWLFGQSLGGIPGRPTAIYTSAFPSLFQNHYRELLPKIGNLSCGYDYPGSMLSPEETDVNKKKAWDVWVAMNQVREEGIECELYMSCTLTRANVDLLEKIYGDAQKVGAFCSFNSINFGTDSKFDFFPSKDVIGNLAITKEQYERVRQFIQSVDRSKMYIWQNYLHFEYEEAVQMGWHCKGDPYGGPTVDCDGSLRLCGYRKGRFTPGFSVWDLVDKEKLIRWRRAVYNDAAECPGCSWSCPMAYKIRGVREEDLKWTKRKS